MCTCVNTAVKSRMIDLLLLACGAFVLVRGQNVLLFEAPQNASLGVGITTNLTCYGDGKIVWEINEFQIRGPTEAATLINEGIFSDYARVNSSTTRIIGSSSNNGTKIVCRVEKSLLNFEASEPAYLLVYGLPGAPSNLNVEARGRSFNLSWTPPFAHEGEDVDYSIDVRKRSTDETVNVIAPHPPFLFDQVIGARDCATYDFTVRSQNDVGLSDNGILASEEVPTDTSSTQSVTVTIDDNYIGTVTCSYAPGATSTGCLVSFYVVDAAMNRTFLFTNNITRPDTTLTDIQFNPVPDGGMIVAEVQDLVNGSVGDIVVPAFVTGPFTPTSQPPATMTPTPPVTQSTSPTLEITESTPTPLLTQEMLYIIVGAGGGGILLLVLLILCTICVICCCSRGKKQDYATVHRPVDDLSPNNAYGGANVHLTGANSNGLNRTRNNTYINNDDSDLTVSEVGPAYATIEDAKKAAEKAGATLASNPIYATAAPGGSQAKLVNGSKTNLVDNPVYSDANPSQKAKMAYSDVSALNPIYSGTANPSQVPVPVPVPAPVGLPPPHNPEFPYKSDSPLSPSHVFTVPQPSLSGSNSTVSQSQSANQLNRSQSTDVVPPYHDPTYSYAEIRGHPSMRTRTTVSTSSEQEKPGPVKRNESYGMLASSMSPPTSPAPPPPVPPSESTF